jgi:hypothetical protein
MMGKELVMSEQLRTASDKLVDFIGYNPMEPVFHKANVVLAVKEWLGVPEVRNKIMALQGTEAGFVTDMDEKGGYDERTMVNAVTVALVSGFHLVGNEFNIIAGKFYGAKNGYKRKCREFEDAKFKAIHVGDPDNGEILETPTTVVIPFTITYTILNKETQQKVTKTMKKRIQFTKKSRDTVDAWLGKGAKRLYQRLLSEMSGMEYDFDEPAGDGVFKEDTPTPGRQNLGQEKKTDKPDADDAVFSPAAEPTATSTETAPPEPDAGAAAAPQTEAPPAAAEGEETPAALSRGRRPPAKGDRF